MAADMEVGLGMINAVVKAFVDGEAPKLTATFKIKNVLVDDANDFHWRMTNG